MSRLMYGLHPDLDLKKIKDMMSNHESGYSFVQDPGNDLRSEYLKLSSRACLDPIDGLMSGERWNFDAVRRYLKEESSLLLHIFQLLFLRAGQSGWSVNKQTQTRPLFACLPRLRPNVCLCESNRGSVCLFVKTAIFVLAYPRYGSRQSLRDLVEMPVVFQCCGKLLST